jgi:DNA polymerase-3 subunit epsilon
MIALFFDTETTGFPNPKNPPEIVQIGALLQDIDSGRILGELNLLVQVTGQIPEQARAVHGIDNDLTYAFGLKSNAADRMFAWLAQKADVVVAHNIKFDTDIINGIWPQSEMVLRSKRQFCTMLQSEKIVGLKGTHAGGTKWPKLIEAYRHFYGTDFDGAHDAMVDVRACRDVFLKLNELNKQQEALNVEG